MRPRKIVECCRRRRDRRDDARPAQLDGPAPLKATEDSQPLIRRDAARDVVSASIF